MNIDNLTYGEIKAIAAMVANTTPAPAATHTANSAVGKFCIVRANDAGVHAGTVTEVNGDTVTLKDSRRLWSWTAKAGIALSGVAQHGVKKCEGTKLDALNPEIVIRGWFELIPCTEAAKVSIREV